VWLLRDRDVVGLTLLVIFGSAFQVMLDKGRDLDWFQSPFIGSMAMVSRA